MKKRVTGKKLNRTSNERKQLLRQLMSQLVERGFIVTSKAKAQFVRPNVEKLVTIAKNDSLANFRRLIAESGSVSRAHKLQEYGKLFSARPGGYTRMFRYTSTVGDNSPQVRLEWVEQIAQASIQPVVSPKVDKSKVAEEKKQTPKMSKPRKVSQSTKK